MPALSVIGRQIQQGLAASMKRDPSTVKPEHHLRDDLGLDSLMVFELLYDLEKTFDLDIPNEDLPGLHTLGDVITYIEARVGKTPPPVTGATRDGGNAVTRASFPAGGARKTAVKKVGAAKKSAAKTGKKKR